ncbi:septal ring lytic transglycosylase RlpA family protein [Kaarinaea lacus]
MRPNHDSKKRFFGSMKYGLPVGAICLLSACSTMITPDDGPPNEDANGINFDTIADAIPKAEPLSKSGNPSSYVVNGSRYYVMQDSSGYQKRGTASWYGTKFHGRRTSSGEPYDMYAMTAAHKTLPIPTYVKVRNLNNQKQVVVRVNDRGPFHDNRLIDLSYAAAKKLGIVENGTADVEVTVISSTNANANSTATERPAPTQNNHSEDRSSHYLQVGAFAMRDNAVKMVSELSLHTSAPIHISNANNHLGTLYRVRIGPFPDRIAVESIESQLSQMGFIDTQIVIDR